MAAKKRKARKASSSPAIATDAPDDSWRARNDLETIQRAHEIVGDSSRFNKAKAEAARQKASLERIGRLEGKKL